eukprot:223562_1
MRSSEAPQGVVTDQEVLEKLTGALDPNISVRKPCEDFLKSQEYRKGFPLTILKIVANDSSPMQVRMVGAVFFKRFVERNFKRPEDELDCKPEGVVDPEDQQMIKQHLVSMMLSSPSLIAAQLSMAITTISKRDFPENWQGLIQEMVGKMSSGDFGIICGVLKTCNSIFYRYQHETRSDTLWREIQFVIDNLGVPLTELFVMCIEKLKTTQDKATVAVLLECLTLIAESFLSLNHQDIPEFFDTHAPTWMGGFLFLLEFQTNLFAGQSDEEPGPVEKVKTGVCKAILVYNEKYDDIVQDYRSHVPKFLQAIWNLLTNLSLAKQYDQLVAAGMQYLTSVVRKKWNSEYFKEKEMHRLICEKIIIPNIRLRESDVEEFQMNALEYVRRDMEESDSFTRRRMAVNLVQGLCLYYEGQVSEILFGYISTLMEEYSKDPAKNWFSKDAALFLVIAIAVKKKTVRAGATEVNQNVNVPEFMTNHVFPELTSENIEQLPILKADCIKFVYIFRSMLPETSLAGLVPILARYLRHSEFVVHTYAACTIDKMISLKNGQTHKRIISQETLKPILGDLLTGLFGALESPDSKENEYVMKCITRVCVEGRADLKELVSIILDKVIAILMNVAKNPTAPNFNHYLFESISALIQTVCTPVPAMVANFEQRLFPVFEQILNMDTCDEFPPYVFQLFGQMLRVRQQITEPYKLMFPVLMNASLWMQRGNVQPLTNLLVVFLSKAGEEIVRNKQLQSLLGVFQKLLSQKSNDHHAFAIMQAIIEFIPLSALEQYIPEIMRLVFTKLQTDKSNRFVKNFCVFCGHFLAKHGYVLFVKSLDLVQKDIFGMILERVIIRNAKVLDTELARKICVFGLIRVLCAPEFIQSDFARFWPVTMQYVIEIFEMAPAPYRPEEDDLEELERAGYNAQYARLAYARDRPFDPVKKFGDVRKCLAEGLGELSKKFPGKLTPMISANLSEVHRKALADYLQTAGVSLL